MIAALSFFIHRDPATPAENGCRCGGTKWTKYKWWSQNTSQALALPFIYCTNISGRQRQSLSDAGAPLTCSHSTLAKQNRVRDKQQIGYISWPQWQRARFSGGLLLQSAWLVFWAVLPNSQTSRFRLIEDLAVTLGGQGWNRLIDRIHLPLCTFCWANSLIAEMCCASFSPHFVRDRAGWLIFALNRIYFQTLWL